MANLQADKPYDLSELAGVESAIFNTLNETSDELAHAECFDSEQRAEIYTILETLKSDNRTHQKMVKQLSDLVNRSGGPDDA